VAEPLPLRTFAIGATACGAFLIESATVRGPVAAIGLVLVALGLAAFDAIDRGQVERRHAGLVAVIVGGGLGTWALAIVTLLALLKLPVDTHLWVVLALATAGLILGGAVIRGGVLRSDRRLRRRP
jgi:hypothetical protein